jgi:hypothetical protein
VLFDQPKHSLPDVAISSLTKTSWSKSILLRADNSNTRTVSGV